MSASRSAIAAVCGRVLATPAGRIATMTGAFLGSNVARAGVGFITSLLIARASVH